ncbi:MAG: signal peptidase I [Chitinophagales bacterium]|nr:signal peptidase I [Bacteroidota bacterium]MCB9043029.1 signal peptidase I [Chitinophagales bacterium]
MKNTDTNKQKKPYNFTQLIKDILWVTVVVTLVQTFLLQSYAIPSSSMEGTMLTGDKLFVSKFTYGARIPITPIAFPFVHNTMPILGTKSYVESVKLPYMRLPGLRKVRNGDIVVFNWPEGDTVTTKYQSAVSYYDLKRQMGEKEVNKRFEIITRPIDRKENYVKRCIAIAGDTLEIKEGTIFINGKAFQEPPGVQHAYIALIDASGFNYDRLKKIGVTEPPQELGTQRYVLHLNADTYEKVKAMSIVKQIEQYKEPAGQYNPRIFPYNDSLVWNKDNIGPLYIPKKGESVRLDSKVQYDLYMRAIRDYENNPTLVWKDDKAYLDGKVLETYTFTKNYYWMMGDNRDNSQDARFWGFTPEDHIVGTPMFVWLSTDNTESPLAFWKWIRWGKSFRIPR